MTNKTQQYIVGSIQKWQARNPKWVKVHNLMMRAYKNGKIKRPEHCSVCKRRIRVEAHHEDYSKPFQITWLCRDCHKATHATLRQLVRLDTLAP